MQRRIIVWLVRKHLGLGIEERFQFLNQYNKNEYYYFTKDSFMKEFPNGYRKLSNVSLNWLLDAKSEVIKNEKR